jgi:hypothetical protein
MNFQYFEQHFKTSRIKVYCSLSLHWVEIDLDPDRQALDADPDPGQDPDWGPDPQHRFWVVKVAED